MNAQEIYDKVAVHLLTQNAKSMKRSEDDGEFCAYRGDEGRKCAAGCLLTDEEAGVADALPLSSWELAEERLDLSRFAEHSGLIRELQAIHDHTKVNQWGVELARLAVKHNLSTAVLR